MANNPLPEDFIKHILKPDDAFNFRCKQCGRCCKNREDIILSPFDLYRISQCLSISPQTVVERYCHAYIGQSSRMPVVLLRAIGKERACPFLKNSRCSIHHSKPTACALFPLGRAVGVSQDAPKPTDMPEGIFYFLQPTNCGGRDEVHTVKEWLGEFNLEESDRWFDIWQTTIRALFPLVTAFEEKITGKPLEVIRSIMFVALYFDYEGMSEFLPHFEENAAKLIKALNDLLSCADNLKE